MRINIDFPEELKAELERLKKRAGSAKKLAENALALIKIAYDEIDKGNQISITKNGNIIDFIVIKSEDKNV